MAAVDVFLKKQADLVKNIQNSQDQNAKTIPGLCETMNDGPRMTKMAEKPYSFGGDTYRCSPYKEVTNPGFEVGVDILVACRQS